ncbi:MAG: hypothetical protein AAFX87_19545 [Bacteroidota bacterium]
MPFNQNLKARLCLIACFSIVVQTATAQSKDFKKLRYREKTFQLSLFPGVSTNGLESGRYFNKYSINLFGGLSAGTRFLELGLITNLNTQSSNGIQLAGLANVVGTNTFLNMTLREERETIKEGFSADFQGIQLAGILNLVRNNVKGIQLSGLFNMVYQDAYAFQLSGIGNVTHGHLVGVQLSGLYNVASKSVTGMQVALLSNTTRGTLFGSQIGLFNSNRGMAGKRIKPPTKARSFQLGLYNKSREMGGTQIGLVNVAKEMSGTQIGLINFFKKTPVKNATKSGVPIGLLNFGSKGHFTRFSYNDQFVFNVERSTGNCSNCSDTQYGQPLQDRYQKFNQNSIIFSYNPSSRQEMFGEWALGWRFERLMYIKRSMFPKRSGPQNGAHFLSWGSGVQYVDRGIDSDTALSILSSFQGSYGKQFGLFGIQYLYLTARINSYFYQDSDFELEVPLPLLQNDDNRLKYAVWVGYTVGVQL